MTTLKSALRSALAAAALTALAAPALAQPAVQPQAAAASELTNLEQLAASYVDSGKVANMVIGVSLPDGSVRWVEDGTLALDGDTAADEQSIYRIYSMTKPVTGMAAALLIEEGKLGLDQPLSDFFPQFAEMHVLTDPDTAGETVAAKNAITVRHLLTHTAGFGYSIIPSGIADAYREAGIVPGQRRPNPMMPSGEQPASLTEFMERLSAFPLRSEPGTEWSYSIGLDVMGAVIEKASGMPFEQFLQTRIFDPVGMDDTGFVVPQEDLGRLTTNYYLFQGNLMPIDTPADSEYASAAPFPSGGGGLASTAEDYLRFMTAMANGGMLDGQQVLPADAVKLATSNIMPPNVEYQGGGGYGAGGRVVTMAGQGPMGSYGWGGAAGTLATAMPNERSAVVLMTQYMPQNAYGLQEALADALMKDLGAMAAGMTAAANDNE